VPQSRKRNPGGGAWGEDQPIVMHLKEVGGLWVADPAVEGRVCLEGPAGAGDLVSKELGERASKIQGSQCLGPAGVLGRMGCWAAGKAGREAIPLCSQWNT
jgi:hypothetical protein